MAKLKLDFTIIYVQISSTEPIEGNTDNNVAINNITVGEEYNALLAISVGTSNIAPFEEGTSRTIPVTVYCYGVSVNNISLKILDDANLSISHITPNFNLNPGDKFDYLIQIEVLELDENVSLGGKTIVVQAFGDNDIFSNAEMIDILIHKPIEETPGFTTVAVIAAASMGALVAFFRRRH